MRKKIPPSLRFLVLAEAGHRCMYCGAQAPETPLVVDHRVPVSKGGTNDRENLVAACAPCNAGRSDSYAQGVRYGSFTLPTCDICHELIETAHHGIIRWSRASCLFVHKSFVSELRCDRQATAGYGSSAWEDLTTVVGDPPNIAHAVERMIQIRKGGAPEDQWLKCLASLLSFDRIETCRCTGCLFDESFAGEAMGGRRVQWPK